MVPRSHTRGGRSSADIPDVEMRSEIEFREEPEIDNLSEIQVFMSTICEGGSGTTRPDIPAITSEYVAADMPQTSAAFSANQEIITGSNPNFSTPTEPPHILHCYRTHPLLTRKNWVSYILKFFLRNSYDSIEQLFAKTILTF